MIKCTKENLKEILDYIGDDYGKCAYLYIDLMKYGFDNENVNMWWQKNKEDKIVVITLQYYNGMHVFSQKGDFDGKDVAELVMQQKPALVCGMKETIDKVEPYVSNYEIELGKILELGEYQGIYNPDVYMCGVEELEEIAKLLAEDEEMGGPYGYELLYKQLKERFEDGFGRNWVRRDEKGVVSHCATYAELDDIAVISGGIVREDYRGQKQYPGQLGAMCKTLSEEGKKVISYYYGGAKTAHKKVGFNILGDWAKLIRQD